MEKDYYQILGVDEKADEKTIRDAFRKLALQYHPDRNRDNPDAASRMKEINEAYAVLSDPEKRNRYDALKQAYGSGAYDHFKQSYTEHDIFRGSDINQILNEISRAFGFRNFDKDRDHRLVDYSFDYFPFIIAKLSFVKENNVNGLGLHRESV